MNRYVWEFKFVNLQCSYLCCITVLPVRVMTILSAHSVLAFINVAFIKDKGVYSNLSKNKIYAFWFIKCTCTALVFLNSGEEFLPQSEQSVVQTQYLHLTKQVGHIRGRGRPGGGRTGTSALKNPKQSLDKSLQYRSLSFTQYLKR